MKVNFQQVNEDKNSSTVKQGRMIAELNLNIVGMHEIIIA